LTPNRLVELVSADGSREGHDDLDVRDGKLSWILTCRRAVRPCSSGADQLAVGDELEG
jgi:hypothetical protein